MAIKSELILLLKAEVAYLEEENKGFCLKAGSLSCRKPPYTLVQAPEGGLTDDSVANF